MDWLLSEYLVRYHRPSQPSIRGQRGGQRIANWGDAVRRAQALQLTHVRGVAPARAREPTTARVRRGGEERRLLDDFTLEADDVTARSPVRRSRDFGTAPMWWLLSLSSGGPCWHQQSETGICSARPTAASSAPSTVLSGLRLRQRGLYAKFYDASLIGVQDSIRSPNFRKHQLASCFLTNLPFSSYTAAIEIPRPRIRKVSSPPSQNTESKTVCPCSGWAFTSRTRTEPSSL